MSERSELMEDRRHSARAILCGVIADVATSFVIKYGLGNNCVPQNLARSGYFYFYKV
jgi:hypothetical protein